MVIQILLCRNESWAPNSRENSFTGFCTLCSWVYLKLYKGQGRENVLHLLVATWAMAQSTTLTVQRRQFRLCWTNSGAVFSCNHLQTDQHFSKTPHDPAPNASMNVADSFPGTARRERGWHSGRNSVGLCADASDVEPREIPRKQRYCLKRWSPKYTAPAQCFLPIHEVNPFHTARAHTNLLGTLDASQSSSCTWSQAQSPMSTKLSTTFWRPPPKPVLAVNPNQSCFAGCRRPRLQLCQVNAYLFAEAIGLSGSQETISPAKVWAWGKTEWRKFSSRLAFLRLCACVTSEKTEPNNCCPPELQSSSAAG